MEFATPSFSLKLPPGGIDASTYAWVYPELGGNNPARLSVSSSLPLEIPDLAQYLAEQRQLIEAAYDNFEMLETVENVRGSWNYVILKFSWGSEDLAQIQKEIHLFIDAEPLQFYRFISSAPTAAFTTAEPMFDQVLASFKPTAG
ncbi:MAG: hypothetical protein AAGG11_01125 [Pseudomonadota bacterium]